MTETNNFYAVIMAGGGGTRLWPLSRRKRPKQMLHLFGEKTLFQYAVERLENLFPIQQILIVTNELQAKELKEQCPQLLANNFLLEPQAKGTAPAIGLAAAYLQKINPAAVMAVLTADHFIGNENKFIHYLLAGKDLALQDHLVTLGIDPTYPATQYGYIQQGQKIKPSIKIDAFHVVRFKEKPEINEAKSMLKQGHHTWNSGMFVWKAGQILQEFKRQIPETYQLIINIADKIRKDEKFFIDASMWEKLSADTIDFAIMENAKNVVVIPTVDLEWNDVGSWNSLFEVLTPDKDGNVIVADQQINLGSQNSLVHTGSQEKIVVTIGVKDLVVVDTGDVLLICSKEQAQDVRKIIELLKESGLNQYL